MRTNFALGLLLALTLSSSSCYYTHLARGQAELMCARRPVAEVVGDPATPEHVREQLALVEQAREFAARLGLDVDEQYTSYAEWPGDRVITTVVATRPREVEPNEFAFPIVGRVPYKGFFDEARARAEAEKLEARGLDTCLVPVTAYSTLGWFDDPLTGPMVRLSPGRLVETVIHELVHNTVYAPDQAQFNEGIATFVGQEAAVRFFAERSRGAADSERRRITDSRAIARAYLNLRDRVAELYAQTPADVDPLPQRDSLEAAARRSLAALPLQAGDAEGLADDAQLNDACLSLTGTYTADLPGYGIRLRELGGDLAALIREAVSATDATDPRAALLPP
jgi:predicted aminopeptidase